LKEKPFNNIGSRIKIVRTTQGISQMALAEKLGLSYQQVQKYENGTSKISVTRLAQIANALRIPAQSLLTAEPAISGANNAALSEKELRLLVLFRKLKGNKAKDAILSILEDVTKISPMK